MRPSRPLFTALALLVASLGTSARAQSLVELYEAARVYDATYLAARAQAESAESRVAQVDALGRPRADVTTSLNYNATVAPGVATAQDPDPGQRRSRSAALGASVTSSYPLFNRANGITIEQAQKSLVVATADLEAAEQDLIIRLSQGYFDVLAAQDALTTTRASKKSITEQLASAKRNFEVGTSTITDTREAQARFDLATAQEIAAENDLRTKRIALDQLVGRSGVEPKGLLVPVALPSTEPSDTEAWVSTADTAHPSVRKARLALDIAKLETDKARAAQLPTVDAVASLSRNELGRSYGSLTNDTSIASAGVQLKWPLFTGGATQNRIKETLSLEEKSRNDLEAARRGVAQGTRVAYFGVQSGAAQVKALEAAESSSKLALEATQLGYKVGVRVNLDVLNAQTQLFQTQRDLAKARYDVLVGSLRLRQAAGQLKADDLRAVNALLVK